MQIPSNVDSGCSLLPSVMLSANPDRGTRMTKAPTPKNYKVSWEIWSGSRVVMAHATNSDSQEHHTRKASRRLALRESMGRREPEAARDDIPTATWLALSAKRRASTLVPPHKTGEARRPHRSITMLRSAESSREGGCMTGSGAQRVDKEEKVSCEAARGAAPSADTPHAPHPLPHGWWGRTRADGTVRSIVTVEGEPPPHHSVPFNPCCVRAQAVAVRRPPSSSSGGAEFITVCTTECQATCLKCTGSSKLGRLYDQAQSYIPPMPICPFKPSNVTPWMW